MEDYDLFYVEPENIPEPINKDEELKTINCILDVIEEKQSFITARDLHSCGGLTPWIAFQIGCISTYFFSEGKLIEALYSSHASVVIAKIINEIPRIYANSISFANVLLKLEYFDLAKEAFLNVLEISYLGDKNEKRIAQISLANIYNQSGQLEEAIYYYEKVIPHLSSFPDKVRELILKSMYHIYIKFNEIAGYIFCSKKLGLLNNNELKKQILSNCNSYIDFFTTSTRLRSLHEIELADFVYKTWKDKYNN